MKKVILPLFLVLVATNLAFAQLSAPNVESVYGGRINAITGFALNADTSRIFISTESANSIFYADMHTNTSTPVFTPFTVMPGVNATAGYDANIHQLAAHGSSGLVYFIHQSGLLSSHPSTATVHTVYSGNVEAVKIQESYLFFKASGQLYFGTLDVSGNFSNGIGSPLTSPSLPGMIITIYTNPVDSTIYLFSEGNSPKLYKSSNTFNTFSGSTNFTDISPTSLSTSYTWQAFGIGPDGRLFIGGSDPMNKRFAYSDDDGTTWTEYATGFGGVSGNIIACGGDSTAYSVYFASVYNSDKGLSGNWDSFGQPGGWETHPNDGAVFADPINQDIVYLTTDQGLGVSVDRGSTIFEINDGIEAVQVRGFDMSADKNVGWLASKSGIRKVTNYLTSPLWTNSIFPNTDGSPYYSAEMVPGDTSSVYVGNVRVYKTMNDGHNWQQVFTPENAPYNFSGFGAKALAIEVCEFDTNIVFAGFEIQGPEQGGLFYSLDAGITWNQLLLEASTIGMDADVSDIVFTIDGGDTVAYVGVQYDLSSPSPRGRSVYKVTKSGATWTPAQDMNSSTTSTSTTIVVTIWDLEVSVTGDTIFACGTDAGINHPVAYYKPLNGTNLWTPLTTTGFPMGNAEATAITVGIDTVYCAVANEIYYFPISASSWTLGYSYPVGQRINFLYFDELLVGTETGLYGHLGLGTTTSVKEDKNSTVINNFSLSQNYPNPFNPSTVIRYTIPEASKVTLKIYNILGKEIETLVDEQKHAGVFEAVFDASKLADGIYFYKITTEDFSETKKMLLVK